MQNKLLLCTDMDRTIIPNGEQQESANSREQFRQLCGLPSVTLVYVTGRHLQLVTQAIADYDLPHPEYAITDVGTKIYQQVQNEWREIVSWQDQIARDWRGQTCRQLQSVLSGLSGLNLQEENRQNDFKLSYYLSLDAPRLKILREIEGRLAHLGVAASVIWSVDEPANIGLIDVLPQNATKLHAVEFLQHHLRFELEEVIFAGDSGNDLPVLASPIRSILVANAAPDIKEQAQQLAEMNGCQETLYIARQEGFMSGGSYSAGVLQGVAFFAPEITEELRE